MKWKLVILNYMNLWLFLLHRLPLLILRSQSLLMSNAMLFSRKERIEMRISSIYGHWVLVNQIATGLSNCGNGDHGSNGSELDTQTNMIVADKQAYLFSYSGLNAKVRTFSDEAKRIQDMHIDKCT